jgi:hypothetical protein
MPPDLRQTHEQPFGLAMSGATPEQQSHWKTGVVCVCSLRQSYEYSDAMCSAARRQRTSLLAQHSYRDNLQLAHAHVQKLLNAFLHTATQRTVPPTIRDDKPITTGLTLQAAPCSIAQCLRTVCSHRRLNVVDDWVNGSVNAWDSASSVDGTSLGDSPRDLALLFVEIIVEILRSSPVPYLYLSTVHCLPTFLLASPLM